MYGGQHQYSSNKLDNNNGILIDYWSLFVLHTLPHALVCLTDYVPIVVSVLTFFYPFDHYAAFWFPLTDTMGKCH